MLVHIDWSHTLMTLDTEHSMHSCVSSRKNERWINRRRSKAFKTSSTQAKLVKTVSFGKQLKCNYKIAIKTKSIDRKSILNIEYWHEQLKYKLKLSFDSALVHFVHWCILSFRCVNTFSITKCPCECTVTWVAGNERWTWKCSISNGNSHFRSVINK